MRGTHFCACEVREEGTGVRFAWDQSHPLATHGRVTDQNAHPHFDASGKLALVHNGVIENYQALKDELIRDGDTNFRSETDTEVLAHLIGKLYNDSCASTADVSGKKARLFDAVRTALRQVVGTYGIA